MRTQFTITSDHVHAISLIVFCRALSFYPSFFNAFMHKKPTQTHHPTQRFVPMRMNLKALHNTTNTRPQQ